MKNLPDVPESWTAPIPKKTLSRLIAGVRSEIGKQVTEEQVERRRVAEGEDMGCTCCGDPNCFFAENTP